MFTICELMSLVLYLHVSTGTGLPYVGRYPRTSGTERSVGAMLLSYPADTCRRDVDERCSLVWRLAGDERGLVVSTEEGVKITV